jgi:hypothetical protein
MFPRRDKTTEGRVNPKGIPCLYLATDENTAMSEVRPGKTEPVTLAKCETVRDLKLVDCSSSGPILIVDDLKQDSDELMERLFWHHIDNAFSTPVNATDDLADYAPTQVVAEVFRRLEYDGIMYKSELAEGKNIALFEITDAEIVSLQVYKATSVKYEFDDSDNYRAL